MSGVLVTGGTGLLGPYLAEAAESLGPVVATGGSRGDRTCDLTDAGATAALLDETGPELVIHSAAMTDVDKCERDPESADRINRGAVANIVEALDPASTLVMISTDQVYPDSAGPHREGGEAPVNAYGRTKLAGEEAALRHPNALVLRVNFFGPSRTAGRSSLSDWLIGSLKAREEITLFSDSLFSPLHLSTLAQLVVTCAGRGLKGVFNAGCRGGTSKADFGLAVARHLDLQTQTATVGRSTAIPGRAPRPGDLRMAVDKIETALGMVMPGLDEEIAKL